MNSDNTETKAKTEVKPEIKSSVKDGILIKPNLNAYSDGSALGVSAGNENISTFIGIGANYSACSVNKEGKVTSCSITDKSLKQPMLKLDSAVKVTDNTNVLNQISIPINKSTNPAIFTTGFETKLNENLSINAQSKFPVGRSIHHNNGPHY